MTAKSNSPSANADISELHAWAGHQTAASAGGGGAVPAAPAGPVRKTDEPGGLRGGPMLPKVLIVAGIVLAGYLVFSFVVHLLMMMLMVVGGAALVYGAYRLGYRNGSRGR